MPQIDIPQSVLDWMHLGEHGVSSETIVEHIYGVPLTGRFGKSHPHDPSDLRRCLLLLQASPETRERLPAMATCSPTWKRLTEHWGELEALFIEESGGSLHREFGWSAPKTYAAMRAAIDSK